MTIKKLEFIGDYAKNFFVKKFSALSKNFKNGIAKKTQQKMQSQSSAAPYGALPHK